MLAQELLLHVSAVSYIGASIKADAPHKPMLPCACDGHSHHVTLSRACCNPSTMYAQTHSAHTSLEGASLHIPQVCRFTGCVSCTSWFSS